MFFGIYLYFYDNFEDFIQKYSVVHVLRMHTHIVFQVQS